MKINLKSNMQEVQARIGQLGHQLPYIAAGALSRAAKDGQAAIRTEMARVFDRPTTYALNGTYVKVATQRSLEAKVMVKDSVASKGTTADRFLMPHIDGGSRALKGMERALQGGALMPRNSFAVPAAGAKMDSHGNVKRSQIVQIMSQLRVQRTGGFESRRSDNAASKRAVARQGVTYFALPAVRRGLAPGVYARSHRDRTIKPVFLFVSRVAYQRRLRFHEVGTEAGMKSFSRHFEALTLQAIANARLGLSASGRKGEGSGGNGSFQRRGGRG